MKVQNKIIYPIVGTALLTVTLGLSAVCPQACFADDLNDDNVPALIDQNIYNVSGLESVVDSMLLAKAKAYCDVSKECRSYTDLIDSLCNTETELQIIVNRENEKYMQFPSEESKNAALEAANKIPPLKDEIDKLTNKFWRLTNKQNILEREFRFLYCSELGIEEQVLMNGQNPALNDYSLNDAKQWYYRLNNGLKWGDDSLLESFMSIKNEISLIPPSDRDYTKFIQDFKMLRSDLNSRISVSNGEIDQAMKDIHKFEKDLITLEQKGEIARLDATYTPDEFMKIKKFNL